MKTLKLLSYITAVALVVASGCTEDELGPKVPDVSEFEAPVITNVDTSDPVEFLPEDATEVYETFRWERTNYGGVNLSTQYSLQIDTDEDFGNPQEVAATSADSSAVTVEDFNDAMLALGIPGFEEATVYVRLKSTVIGQTWEALYSNVIQRTAITYQLSECGDFCSLGVVGSATPGGWSDDTDMRLSDPEKIDKHSWTVIVYLTNGNEVKIRAADSWDNNWGGTTWPSGTGVAGGANIPVNGATGYYKLDFNDQTLAYTFTQVTGSYTTVGIIGTATAGGWGSDTDLTQDGSNPHIWTGTITLTAGEAKFRANDGWDSNWGATTYPSGYATGGGPNIVVPTGGTYFIYFNDATGEYFFGPTAVSSAFADIGIIGPATVGGWDSDTNLIRNPSNPYKWSKSMALAEGEAKFRANNAWDFNWGASPFPGGVGTQGGANIPVKDGYYFVTFNTLTGEYYFLK